MEIPVTLLLDRIIYILTIIMFILNISQPVMNKSGSLMEDGRKSHQSNAWIIQDDKMKRACPLNETNEEDAFENNEEKRNDNDVLRKRASFAKCTILTIMTFV